MPVIVDTLGVEHAEAYRALMLEAYTQAADAFTSTPEERAAHPLAWWRDRIAHPEGLMAVFGAFDGPALVGTVALEYSARAKTRHKALVVGMYVAPTHRGRGAARALLCAALAHARARPGTTVIQLEVTQGNAPAEALYRSLGFEVFGVEPMAVLTAAGHRAKVHLWRRCDDGPTPPSMWEARP